MEWDKMPFVRFRFTFTVRAVSLLRMLTLDALEVLLAGESYI